MGRPEAEVRPDVLLSGQNILLEHCEFVNEDGSVTLVPKQVVLKIYVLFPNLRLQNAQCYVNGRPISEPTVIHTGSRVILGKYHVFRYNDPQEARQSRHNLSAAASGL